MPRPFRISQQLAIRWALAGFRALVRSPWLSRAAMGDQQCPTGLL